MMARDKIRVRDLDHQVTRPQDSASSENATSEAPIPALNARQNAVLRMQQTQGNAAVRRMMVQRAAAGEDGGPIDEDVTSQINSARGGGQTLDSSVASQMSESMGHDFSDVKVHTDAGADTLNRQLSAKAFTTGSDIFFQQGAYQPSSSDGQHLLAHELTHVVQQSGSTPGGSLTLGPAHDNYEAEADSVAHQAMSATSEATAQREAAHDDDDAEAVQAKREVQRHGDDTCEDCD